MKGFIISFAAGDWSTVNLEWALDHEVKATPVILVGLYQSNVGITLEELVSTTVDAIKEAITSMFGYYYTSSVLLAAITIELSLYNEDECIVVGTEDKTLCTEDDLNNILNRCGLAWLRDRNGYRCKDTLDYLQSGADQGLGHKKL
ncbi:hypothetical protein SCA6_017642 [Theobroma cacao]